MVKNVRALFFDRDGVLIRGINKNRKLYAVLKTKDLRFLPGAIKFLKKYKSKFKIIVVTNQPDIANGKISNETINEMNQKMMRLNLIDEILICPHSKNQKCSCRKPKIGLIKLAEKKYNLNLNQSFLFGDRKSDIDAGFKAGMKTIFIDRKYKEPKPNNQNFTIKSLKNALKSGFKFI